MLAAVLTHAYHPCLMKERKKKKCQENTIIDEEIEKGEKEEESVSFLHLHKAPPHPSLPPACARMETPGKEMNNMHYGKTDVEFS